MTFESSFVRCFGCGIENPKGLQLRPGMRIEADHSVIETVVDSSFDGYKGVVHGGITTTMLDEAIGYWCHQGLGLHAVTAELSVKFLRPVPSGVPLTVHGTGRADGRKIHCSGQVFDSSGSVLAEASGLWVTPKQPGWEAG